MRHHGGTVGASKRLDKMLDALRKHGQLTSLQLQQITGGVAVGSTIADLRKAGIPIPPAEYIGKTQEGRKIYLYRVYGKKT